MRNAVAAALVMPLALTALAVHGVMTGVLDPAHNARLNSFDLVTPDGRVIYTDNPPDDVPAEEVDLPELIIEPATRVRSPASQPGGQAAEPPQASQPLSKPIITSPAEQQVVPPGQRQVTIVAEASSVPLPEGFRYILLINGALHGEPVITPVWTLDNPLPGEQRAQIAIIDASGTRGRVLQVPGAEFGAFTWGYTVDQPLPGLTDKPVVTRDLLPLGSPGAMDLLFALDDRMQDGVLDPG